MFWLDVSLWYFGSSFVWVAFLFAGEWRMSPQFQRIYLCMVYHTPVAVTNYRLISLTPILSKVYQRLVSVRLGHFMECRGVLSTTQFAYRKGIGTCDAILCVAHVHLTECFGHGQEDRMVQIDFSAAFDRVNHQTILFMICSVAVEGSVLTVLTQFLSNRSQNVVVDGCRRKLVNVLSGVNQGSVLGLQLFLLYTMEVFSIVKNKLYGYSDDSTLVAVVPSPAERVAVTESKNHDQNRVSVCVTCGE